MKPAVFFFNHAQASRNHYTVDVVVALYIVPLLWLALETKRPADMDPVDLRDGEKISKESSLEAVP